MSLSSSARVAALPSLGTLWRLVALVSLLLVGAGCGPRWMVVRQAVPNGLKGQRSYEVLPLSFDGLQVGNTSEAQWMSEKDEGQRASWVGDKHGMNDEFAASFGEAAADQGLSARGAGSGAPLIVRATVEWLEPGFYAFVAARPSEMRMLVNIEKPDGELVDQIVITSSTGATIINAASGSRLRADAAFLGDLAADYVASRVYGE